MFHPKFNTETHLALPRATTDLVGETAGEIFKIMIVALKTVATVRSL